MKSGRRRKSASGQIIPLHDCFVANEDGLAFEMTESVSLSAMEEDSAKPHRHQFYEILFVDKGDGQHTIDHTTHDEISSKVFLICPGQVHSWNGVSRINGMLIYFNEEFLLDTTLSVNAVWELKLLQEMGGSGITLNEREKRQLEDLIRLMYREYKNKGHEYASVMRSYLNIFLIQLFRIYQSEKTGYWPEQRSSTLLDNFQKLVNEHITERRTVRFYASELGVSMGYLNEQVKLHVGMSPCSFIKKAIITEAKRLIANTNLSMSEIAQSLGFTDGSYFSRLFKTEIGMSPLKFKQSCMKRPKNRRWQRKKANPEYADKSLLPLGGAK
ncbi:MAG: AraC family transcriptional regulator [Clostridiales Family XIII bacterium]|nr:AraC family transcriptional regulator [Clostridiales Family XIII bacterium]